MLSAAICITPVSAIQADAVLAVNLGPQVNEPLNVQRPTYVADNMLNFHDVNLDKVIIHFMICTTAFVITQSTPYACRIHVFFMFIFLDYRW
mgnify:CR=1 FL=1